MKDSFIINRYARSVVEVLDKEAYKDCLKDIALLEAIFTEQPQLIEILQTRLVRKNKKTTIIDALTEELNLKEMWKQLFFLLIQNGRILQIVNIIREIENHIYEKQNVVCVKLKLARELDQEITDRIIKYLEKVLQKEVIAEIEYNEDILGGFYAETGNMVVDASLKNNLRKFVNYNQQNKFK